MKLHVLVPVFLALLVLAAAADAQALGTDIFTGQTGGRIMRTTPGGAVTTVGSFGYFINMLTMDTDNKSIIALDTLNRAPTTQRVLRIDPMGPTVLATVWTGAPFSYVQSWIEVDQDGDYIVGDGSSGANNSFLFKVRRNGSGVTTLYKGNPGTYFFCFTEDKITGDWIIGDFQSTRKAIIHVDRTSGTIKTVVPIAGISATGMVQDPQRPEIIFSAGSNTFLSYHPVTHAVATIVTGAGSANASTLDRAPDGTGALLYAGMTTGAIVKFDRKGTNLGTVGTTGAGSILGVCFDKSRNLGPELMKAPNDRIIRLSFPGDSGKSYVFALSLSGCKPGVSLLDGRVIPLNPDTLTITTVLNQLPPLLKGNLGVLNAFDEAIVTLNLNSVSNVLKGIRLHAAALVLDPKAPLGISQISTPLLFVL